MIVLSSICLRVTVRRRCSNHDPAASIVIHAPPFDAIVERSTRRIVECTAHLERTARLVGTARIECAARY